MANLDVTVAAVTHEVSPILIGGGALLVLLILLAGVLAFGGGREHS